MYVVGIELSAGWASGFEQIGKPLASLSSAKNKANNLIKKRKVKAEDISVRYKSGSNYTAYWRKVNGKWYQE